VHIYLYGLAPSSPTRQSKQRRRRRFTAQQWSSISGAVERQHAALAKANPSSPRIKPTLATTIGWVLR